MHRWDAGTCWHLETNPIKCTYLPYTYTITVALIYNVCERRVVIFRSLRANTLALWQTTGAMLGSPILPRGRSQLVS